MLLGFPLFQHELIEYLNMNEQLKALKVMTNKTYYIICYNDYTF